jgi:hypothetical protein
MEATNMAKITCAISGITFTCSHSSIYLSPEDGYFHPIFALPYKKLYGLYSKHCAGQLTPTDSYLLFLSFLHSTGDIDWRHHATCPPTATATASLIENNLAQLIKVIETTNIIITPSFKQPTFVVAKDNSLLQQIPNWIAAWDRNIVDFKEGYASAKIQESLTKLENRLGYYLKSGADPKEYSHIVASWASKAADFPLHKSDSYQTLIRSCFNSSKMFSTPLAEIREVKEYCEENIEAGSIHFHALMSTLREGVSRHTNFLGLSAPNSLGYTLLPIDSTKNDTEIESILAKATDDTPKRNDYSSEIGFIRARLRYRVALTKSIQARSKDPKETL